jgi:hypothetical protein
MENDPQRILDRLRAHIAAYKQLGSLTATAGGPSMAFLPIGEHVFRPVLDATGALVRPLWLHRHGGKLRTHCPDALQEKGPPGDYPDCAICALETQRKDWRLRMEKMALMYGHVYRTRHQSPFWQPGQTYVLVLKAAVFETMRAQLDIWMETQLETIGAMLQPHVPGPALTLSVTRQPQWSLALALTVETFPTIALGDWYRPLTACWIGPEFNLAEYHAVLAALTDAT